MKEITITLCVTITVIVMLIVGGNIIKKSLDVSNIIDSQMSIIQSQKEYIHSIESDNMFLLAKVDEMEAVANQALEQNVDLRLILEHYIEEIR